MTRLLITGAAGFLGQAIVRQALADPRFTAITACDQHPLALSHPNLNVLTCDLANRDLLQAARASDCVIHLAGMLGKAAETDPQAAHGINVTDSINLMAACLLGTRFVFASSIAVLGQTTDSRAPQMIYGGHKAAVEIAVEEATDKGKLDGISLRPGGIVARPGQGAALKSAFLSQLFWAVSGGSDITLPVSADATTWLAAAPTVAEQFLRACRLPDLGAHRSLTLPMLRVSFGDLVAGLRRAYPNSPSRVDFAPEPEPMRLFGQAPDFDFTNALQLGLAPDPDIASLIKQALPDGKRP